MDPDTEPGAASGSATPHRADGSAPGPLTPDRLRVALLGTSIALLLLVSLSRPNAAQPGLGPRGWAPGSLVPLTLGPAAVTAVTWAAYLLGAAGVVLGLRHPPRAVVWAVPLAIAALSLAGAPTGSADHLNYAAYGRILTQGGDPYVEAPADWRGGTDPVAGAVEEPWRTEPSIYGPAATALHGVAATFGGNGLRQVVWVWQVLVVFAWLAVRRLLLRVLEPRHHGRVDVLWTLNPLIVSVGLLGAHVDTVATAFSLAAVWAATRLRGAAAPLAAGVLVALAGSTKFTYAVVGAGLLGAWWVDAREGGRRRAEVARAGALLVGAALVVVTALHLWAGPHVLDQLLRSRRSVSLATPWRLLLRVLGDPLGGGTARTLIVVLAAVLAVLLAAAIIRLSRPVPTDSGPAAVAARALWLTGVLSAAYALAAPYSLPWYDLLAWACLPAVLSLVVLGRHRTGPGVVETALLARLLVMCAAYVPGRVLGTTPAVAELTMGYRRHVAPWLNLLVWLGIGLVSLAPGARRGSERPCVPPPPARGPRPRR